MAIRNTKHIFSKFSDRRKLAIQRLQYETLQSLEKTFKNVSKARDIDWDTNTTGSVRFVGTGRYLGFGTETRDKPNEI